MSIWSRFTDWLFAYQPPPRCPQCKGSGQDHLGYGDIRYWQGIAYRVCDRCMGSGVLD